jgi:hypothetical protein
MQIVGGVRGVAFSRGGRILVGRERLESALLMVPGRDAQNSISEDMP